MAVAKLGVVYPPRAVAAQIVERTLAPLVAGKSGDAILALRVCDFAGGEGAFLVEVVRFLAAAHGGRDAARLVAQHCVFGADIDPAAVATARAVVEGFACGPVPAAHLRTGDALALAWDRFAAVVGNPPYIRQEKLAPATKQALRGYASYDGVADLYVYFLELAHRLTRESGRYGVIVPAKWLPAAYARPLRAWPARATDARTARADRRPRRAPARVTVGSARPRARCADLRGLRREWQLDRVAIGAAAQLAALADERERCECEHVTRVRRQRRVRRTGHHDLEHVPLRLAGQLDRPAVRERPGSEIEDHRDRVDDRRQRDIDGARRALARGLEAAALGRAREHLCRGRRPALRSLAERAVHREQVRQILLRRHRGGLGRACLARLGELRQLVDGHHQALQLRRDIVMEAGHPRAEQRHRHQICGGRRRMALAGGAG